MPLTPVLDIRHDTGTDNKQTHDTRDRDVHCLIITGLNQGARLLIALVTRSRIALVRPSGTGAAIAAIRGARLVGIRLIRIGLIRIRLVGVGSNGIRGARAQAQHRGTEFALGSVHSLKRGVLVCGNILGILKGDLELLPSLRSVRILVEALGLLDQSGKTIEVKCRCLVRKNVPKGCFIAGRHIMTCCVQDIQFAGIICVWDRADEIRNDEWAIITARLDYKFHRAYGRKGPVFTVQSVQEVEKPEEPVATFY